MFVYPRPSFSLDLRCSFPAGHPRDETQIERLPAKQFACAADRGLICAGVNGGYVHSQTKAASEKSAYVS